MWQRVFRGLETLGQVQLQPKRTEAFAGLEQELEVFCSAELDSFAPNAAIGEVRVARPRRMKVCRNHKPAIESSGKCT